MSTFVLMRLLESAPRRYDLGIRLLSLGRIGRIHSLMAAEVQRGDRALEIGCGTGSLALLCAGRGARVTAIDLSPQMLDVARAKAEQAGAGDQVGFKQTSAIDLDEAFTDGAFDVVLSSLMFSELSGDEQRFVLRQCRRLLKTGGRLLIADEVVPRSLALRLLSLLLRLPLVVVAYVLTQTTTRAVKGLDDMVAQAGFRIIRSEHRLLGSLELVVATKDEGA